MGPAPTPNGLFKLPCTHEIAFFQGTGWTFQNAVTSTATVPVGVFTQLFQLHSVENFPTNPTESSKSSDASNPQRPKFSSTLLF